jgi:hypothetical protein
VSRLIGNCQVCARDQKLHSERMVHHGYKRPGHGFIEGDCPGVGEVPYETSCDLIKSYKLRVENHRVSLIAYLGDLKAGKITHLTELRSKGFRQGHEIVEHVAGVTEPGLWSRVVDSKISEVTMNIGQCESEIERCARRITAWKLVPIRTVEEEVAKADAEKAARKAIKDAAKAARQAKVAALRAKQEALKARREGIKATFRTNFCELAALPKSEDRDAAVRTLCDRLALKKNSFFWVYELGVDDALVTLSLAERGADGRATSYKWPLRRG